MIEEIKKEIEEAIQKILEKRKAITSEDLCSPTDHCDGEIDGLREACIIFEKHEGKHDSKN